VTRIRYSDDVVYTDSTVQAYLDRLASAEPEPGGGSAAALVGALGAALVTMVTELTLGREKFASVEEEIVELKRRTEELRRELESLITLDAQAYAAVAAAMKLPRGDAGCAEERERTLQAALRDATEVPLRVAEAALAVARLSQPAAELGNPHAVSDAGMAVILADAAAQSAALNVKINLAWIHDQEFKHASWSRTQAVLRETADLRRVVLALTDSKI
jgi:formiminotetrahydrofolate cyclodeaminase